MSATEAIDKAWGWHRLPLPLALAVLEGIRMRMRHQNLYDPASAAYASEMTPPAPPAPQDDRYRTARTADGTYNDLRDPAMGSVEMRFGRNVPLAQTYPQAGTDLMEPNPRTISNELLARNTFIPATTLNLTAAAWLQFMVHDWLSHGQNSKEHRWEIPLPADDPWPERPMTILRTRGDPYSPDPDRPPTYSNVVTHWWDASQLYGSDLNTQTRVRSGIDGKLTIGPDGLLPVDPNSGTDITGVQGNWWVGLSMLHTLFTLEHNAVCDRLRAHHPRWSDDELFDHARLVIAALLAKIHTVEWTPAILGHPALHIAMRANWWGLQGEHLSRLIGRLSASEVISGIPGSKTEHFGVPYSITEEFVAVYRMHPLIPDDYAFRSLVDNRLLAALTFPEVADRHAREVLVTVPMADALYSFGTMNPGAITLHNFPRFLRQRVEPDGTLIDLGAIDILRVRERGVPRYNTFRKLMHRRPVRSFEELTDNQEWAEQIRRVYDNDIDRVDLMVGLYAEPLPKGFGFSDTAFRIFALMASRRLNSDRFFTTDFNPATYTKEGMDWIADNGFASVLLRHFPAFGAVLFKLKNPFAPWNLAVPPQTDEPRPEHSRIAPVADAYPPIAVNRSVPEATP
ncbi:MAG: heme peroxidase [Candidatus Dormibacteraeota bacterium]|nr:heme peroxidase [Candidatus Dormibacteraeota bacterium]